MITYDGAHGEVVLFGGGYLDVAKNDTWVWNGTDWIEKHPANSPPERIAGSMAYDPARGEVVLFGGMMSHNAGYYNDTWFWDGTNWSEVLTPNSPPTRAYGGMGFDNSTQSIIYFGGCSNCYGNPTYDETWSFDGSSWTQLNPATHPERMTSFTVASGDQNTPMLVFGGRLAVLTPEGGGGPFSDFLNDVWAFGSPVLSPTSVVSRKTHDTAGKFDVNLPLAGNPGIECRSGGTSGDYTLVFSFVNPLTSVGEANVTSGTGSVSSSAIDSDAHQYIVNLTGVTNAQVVTVSLTNVTDSAGNSSASGIPVSMGVLIGDVNGNGVVSNTDVASVKSEVAAPVDPSNFRNDVNANGVVSNTDVSLTKAQVGTTLP